MAGIGFVLRRLAKRDDLTGLIQAYTHSALASTGPWLFTVIALTGIVLLGQQVSSPEEVFNFKIIITYNFSISLVLTAPVFIVCTRFLADHIYSHDPTPIPGMLIGAHFTILVTQLPIIIALYLFIAKLPTQLALLGAVNFIIISCIWITSTFLTALKDYKSISSAFAIGLFTALMGTAYLGRNLGAVGMVLGFTGGLSIILSLMIAKIFTEYPYPYSNPLFFLSYFTKFKLMVFGGIFFNLGIWIDKWIMWGAPDAIRAKCGLWLNPQYDAAMFLAYLSIAPAMGLFVFSIETGFYEKYLLFYRDIEHKATLANIRENHRALTRTILSSTGSVLVLQGTICLSMALVAPKIVEFLRLPFESVSILRLGLLGAAFHVFYTFVLIILSYFNSGQLILKLQILFFVLNAILTYAFMHLGKTFYGTGVVIAAIVSFFITGYFTLKFVIHLPFHTFITNNTSLADQKRTTLTEDPDKR